MPALQQGHWCWRPGKSKAGSGAVSLVVFFLLFVSLGCAGAWRSIYAGGESVKKSLIHCLRTHMEM